jgi:hypothetical protein
MLALRDTNSSFGYQVAMNIHDLQNTEPERFAGPVVSLHSDEMARKGCVRGGNRQGKTLKE